MTLPKRLAKHLSFANVLACLALFVALGGGAYAAAGGGKISGNKIKQKSIGAGKLKDETITSRQIKKGTLNGTVINVSSLGTVPSAQDADTATRAASANVANTATNAGHATTARTATSAANATNATNAVHAATADSATNAKKADEATRAATAGDADTVGGKTAADLTVRCSAEAELFGGMCWDKSERPIKSWFAASNECAKAGGRLPSLSELVAYLSQKGDQAALENWSSDVTEFSGGDVQVMTAADEDETVNLGNGPGKPLGLGFRCLFYRVN